MVGTNIIKQLGIDPQILDPKKEQTTKKIEYVSTYVENWLWVWVNCSNIRSITFIDAMANAGVYEDGDLCTAAEVVKLFCGFAKKHPKISFRLLINDINLARIQSCVKVCEFLIPNDCTNVTVMHKNMDVNAFLRDAASSNDVPYGSGNAILLFVDPYNMGTVHLNPLREFIKRHYCELLFNYFSSDLNRNRDTDRVQRIFDCFDGIDIPEDVDVHHAFAEALRIGSMKHVFSYSFRNMSNSEIYQIVFVTPHQKGLAKLKEALWEVFHGAAYHRNSRPVQAEQPSLFDMETLDSSAAEGYATDAKERLLEAFAGRSGVDYETIATYLLERTMMKEGQFINYVLRPLVRDGRLRKDGIVIASNFKKDTYTFPSLENLSLQ